MDIQGESSRNDGSTRELSGSPVLNDMLAARLKSNTVLREGNNMQTSGFVIPKLKTSLKSSSASKLNEFLETQLTTTNSVNSNSGFTIPKLKMPTSISTKNGLTQHQLALQKIMDSKSTSMHSVNTKLDDLSLEDSNRNPTIDLTKALSTSLPSQGVKLRGKSQNDSFQVPFIDCDLKEAPLILANIKYCQPNISGFVAKNSVAQPTKFGKITCLRYRRRENIPSIDHHFKPKHLIQRFQFDSKSPDDIVLMRLRK